MEILIKAAFVMLLVAGALLTAGILDFLLVFTMSIMRKVVKKDKRGVFQIMKDYEA